MANGFFIVVLILASAIAGSFILLFNGFFIPGIWLHKNRFAMYGFLFGLALFFLNVLNHFAEGKTLNFANLFVPFVISVGLGVAMGAIFLRWNHRILKNQTKPDLQQGEKVILEDSATLETEDTVRKGIVILTDRRLSFLFLNQDVSRYNLSFSGIGQAIILTSKIGIPDGISFTDPKTSIRVKFPRKWKSEIEKRMKMNTSIFPAGQ